MELYILSIWLQVSGFFIWWTFLKKGCSFGAHDPSITANSWERNCWPLNWAQSFVGVHMYSKQVICNRYNSVAIWDTSCPNDPDKLLLIVGQWRLVRKNRPHSSDLVASTAKNIRDSALVRKSLLSRLKSWPSSWVSTWKKQMGHRFQLKSNYLGWN